MQGLGQQLSAARTARNLTVDDVATRIHMRPEYITALEEERWSDIGDPLYVRGFLRTYSHFLDLSAERFISEYRAAAPEGIKLLAAATPEEIEAEAKRASSRSTMLVAGVAGLLVVGGGLLAVFANGRHAANAPHVAAPASPQAVAARATTAPRTLPTAAPSAARKVAEEEIAVSPEPTAPAARRTPAPTLAPAIPPALATTAPRPAAFATSVAGPRAPEIATVPARTPAPAPTSPIRRVRLPPVTPEAVPSVAPPRAPIGLGSPTVWETPAQTARRSEIGL